MGKAKKQNQEGSDYFDDCEVCRFMRFTEERGKPPTLEEMKEVFKKAKEKGAVVGGCIFEEDLKKN